MPKWEDDISLNHDSTDEFDNLPAPAEMAIDAFLKLKPLPADLIGDRSIESFVRKDHIPIPSVDDREGYNPNNSARFFFTGLVDHLKILAAAKRHNVSIESYFDFGCASGRVLRHFANHTDIPNLWGSDINGRHIQWLNDHMPPNVKVIHNSCIPIIPIADNSIDVVSAFSVFTHIDTFETAWLAELYRVLKPGGICYLSVQNEDTWELMQNAGEKDILYQRFKKIDPGFDQIIQSPIPKNRRSFRYTDLGAYRALVVHSNDYLQKTWGRYFDILEIRKLDHNVWQSVFIGRKK
ncbi:MAG: class I SAM-dependent methyltransferase [Planctomycetota bacterium]